MRQIEILQAGRGIAALAVVLHHASISATAFSGETRIVGRTLEMGYLGVDFFFVLSGFIIYYTAASMPVGEFAWKRAVRIFTPYWPIGLGVAALYFALPMVSAADREWGWFSTLTLLPSWHRPALVVAWTLQHEIVFYCLFALLLVFQRIGIGMALWAAAICMAVPFAPLPDPWTFLLSPINLEFGFGVLAAYAFRRGWRVSPLALGAGFALPFFAFCMTGGAREASVLVGLSIAFALFGLCALERAERLMVPSSLVFLGAASYSLYLIHAPLISVTSRLVSDAGWEIILLAGVAASLAAGILYHMAFERPALDLLNGRFRQAAPTPTR